MQLTTSIKLSSTEESFHVNALRGTNHINQLPGLILGPVLPNQGVLPEDPTLLTGEDTTVPDHEADLDPLGGREITGEEEGEICKAFINIVLMKEAAPETGTEENS